MTEDQIATRDPGQRGSSSGHGPSPTRTNGIRMLNRSLPTDRGWIIPNSNMQVTGEELDSTNHVAASTNNANVAVPDDATQDGSFGTLMLSEGGRSKYLGPTAGSEWLRDVCKLAATPRMKLKYASQRIILHLVRQLRSRLVHRVLP